MMPGHARNTGTSQTLATTPSVAARTPYFGTHLDSLVPGLARFLLTTSPQSYRSKGLSLSRAWATTAFSCAGRGAGARRIAHATPASPNAPMSQDRTERMKYGLTKPHL